MGPYEQSKTFSIFDRNDFMQFFPLVFFFMAFIFLNYYHGVHTSNILWYWSFNFRYLQQYITYVFYNYIIRYYISDIRQLDNYLKVVDVMLNGSTSYLSMIYFLLFHCSHLHVNLQSKQFLNTFSSLFWNTVI